ncbi:uncharacterized protein LOC125538111 [Triticum urartu]|uniref:uncharacterized protein LOC125538111 n=1 Tax=Triticum urartu TaxID=4572 RepID=UPI002042E6BE|nr:uncharacterized protein LOC125538111 [Triticum urartu]
MQDIAFQALDASKVQHNGKCFNLSHCFRVIKDEEKFKTQYAALKSRGGKQAVEEVGEGESARPRGKTNSKKKAKRDAASNTLIASVEGMMNKKDSREEERRHFKEEQMNTLLEICPRAPRHRRATMSPRHRGASGYRGVRQRPNGWYYSKIRSGDVRLSLGTFQTAHEADRAYDAAAWRLDRPRPQMNFQDVYTLRQALDIAPPPRLITDQDHAEHAGRQRRLLIAEKDERAMAEWRRRHPEDIADEQAYWTGQTAKRHAERLDMLRRKALALSQCEIVENGGQSIFSANDSRWDDMWLNTSDQTIKDDNDDDDDD